MPEWAVYEYATIRVVPRVERGEYVNVGVVLLCKARRFLGARFEPDAARILALDPGADFQAVTEQLASMDAVAAGGTGAGALGALEAAERFRWLVAPRSTVVQASPVHTGEGEDPRAALERLMTTMVRLPGAYERGSP